MLISTKGRYAMRLLVDMAEHQGEEFIPLREVANRQGISEKYLESIVRALVRAGILAGVRGKGGGYRLGKEPDQITVWDVLRLTEGTTSPVSCLGENAVHCDRMAYCRTLSLWQGLDQAIREYLDHRTVADLMRKDAPGDDYVI